MTRGKVGFVTEGDAEIASLPELYPQLEVRTNNQFLRPVRANVDPLAPVPVIAKGVTERVRLSIARGATAVVVLLDREDHVDSASVRAAQIQAGLRKFFGGNVSVVVKDRMYENWLISCPASFVAQKGRFPSCEAIRFPEGRGDAVPNATRLIGQARGRGDYEKVADAKRLLQKADVDALARNSRSFRRLLAVIGDPLYASGSCQYADGIPASPAARRPAGAVRARRRPARNLN